MKRSQHVQAGVERARVGGKSRKRRLLVLYGSETGTAEGYAYETATRLSLSFPCDVSVRRESEGPGGRKRGRCEILANTICAY